MCQRVAADSGPWTVESMGIAASRLLEDKSGKSKQGGDARQALRVSTSVSCLPAVPEVDAAVSLKIILVSSTLPLRTLSSSP